MALIYQAQLHPSKIELLKVWVSAQPWWADSDASRLEPVGAYRFDDPDGEVGIETHLLHTADGGVVQVPVTYRGAPLIGAESSLITTAQHSVLGRRWIYDACGDPVYARALAAAILTGGTQADLEFATDTGSERHVSTTQVWGDGVADALVPSVHPLSYVNEASRTLINAGDLRLVVLHAVGDENARRAADAHTLLGRWPGHDTPSLLAFVLGHGPA